ncbi:helix-turn-helix domain-containing protein [Megalodesulfovibrio paquesii]
MSDALTLLTIDETAAILRVHRATVSRLIRSGELPCVLIRSRKLVRRVDLRAFLDNHRGE